MPDKLLKCRFTGNNAHEIMEVLQAKPDSKGYVWARAPMPEFIFYKMQDNLPAGYYEFVVEGLVFEHCWLEPFKVYLGRTYYKSGSYCVRTK